MAEHLVTGHAGVGHVTSADAGAFQAGVCGLEKYVLGTGTKLSYVLESNNLITILGSTALFYKDLITVKNTGIDHRITFHIENKGIGSLWAHACRNRNIGINILFSKNWNSGSNLTNNRNTNNFCSDHIKAIITNFYGTWLGGVTSYISILLQSFKMRMNRGCRFKINSLTNISNSWRETS